MDLSGIGRRGVERVTDTHHTTVMGWIKQALLTAARHTRAEEEPEIIGANELQTFVGNKQNKKELWEPLLICSAAILPNPKTGSRAAAFDLHVIIVGIMSSRGVSIVNCVA